MTVVGFPRQMTAETGMVTELLAEPMALARLLWLGWMVVKRRD
jgi:hypothetical protein